MKNTIALLLLSCLFTVPCFTQTAKTVEVTDAVVDGGTVYVYIFASAEEFKDGTPCNIMEMAASDTIVSQEIALPNGEYVLLAYQDTNNNQKIDFGLFYIPKELIAISNYSGKGFPSRRFDKQKVVVDDSTEKITLGLFKI
jgi:uncharacterized protein (DUF2141 family)